MKKLQRPQDFRKQEIHFKSLTSIVWSRKTTLLRKIEKVIDFSAGFMTWLSTCTARIESRPAVDPLKSWSRLCSIQHLFGIPSLKKTVEEVNLNIAYRWFLGYDLTTKIPHLRTVSYAFARRFPSEVFRGNLHWILRGNS